MEDIQKTPDTIGEKELKDVAGGKPIKSTDPFTCKFVQKTGTRMPYIDSTSGRYILECDAYCFSPLCNCHGTDECVNRWHRFDSAGGHYR